MSKSSAYTLIEILIVMSIIGLMMGVGMVQYRDYARRQALSSATMSMVANLRLAQEIALSGTKIGRCADTDVLVGYKIKFTAGGQHLSIIARCGMGDSTVYEKNIDVPDDIKWSPSPNVFVFKVLGQGTDLTGDFTIIVTQTSTGKTQTITVTKDGKITW